ncbi:hypothetical protein [Nocardia carnea]|uniref:hypothetical protein n=1 Tax=Nocardia carnea TaxID=37328 RepID=UPI002456407A|nr:hypothetical protein [Nocardia carnea]
MIPIQISPEQLPAISAGISAQETSLAALFHTVAPHAVPVPTGFHTPGVLMSVGFGLFQSALFSLLEAGVVEKLNGGATLVPAAGSFEATDTVGCVAVESVGGAVASAVLGN